MNITQAAKNEIKEKSKFLKVIAKKGGCAGMFFDLDYSSEINDLNVIENIILTDEFSLQFMENITLDFIKEIGYEEFKITNPDAKRNCKCGISFS